MSESPSTTPVMSAEEKIRQIIAREKERQRKVVEEEVVLDIQGFDSAGTQIGKSADILIPPESESEDASEDIPSEHDTRAEKVGYLKNLIEKAKGKLYDTKEKLGMSERGEKLKAYLSERFGSLQEQAKKEYGPKAVEVVGSVIERYNKLNWKTKLAVTGTLMLGVSSTAVTLPLVSAALSAALYGQRLVGGIGFGMNKRKALDAKIAANPEHWMAKKSELAKNMYVVALAAVYMGSTAFVVHEGVEFLRSLGVGEWFSGAPGEHHAPDMAVHHAEAPSAMPEPAMQQPEAVTLAPEAAALAAAPEMPDLSVDASAGHGYEYMLKRMWEQLQDKHLDASQYAEGSDIRQLLEADSNTIDGVVHRIAADPSHGFFNADSTSVVVGPDAHMTIGADGHVNLDGAVHAPEGAMVTPEYHAEASTPETPITPEETLAPQAEAPTPPPGVSAGHVDTGNAADFTAQTFPVESAIQPPHEGYPETSAPAEIAAPTPPPEAPAAHDAAPTDASHAPPQPEASHAPAPEASHLVVNAHGLSVDETHAGAYLDTQGNHIIYGGSLDDRAEIAKQLVAKDHSAIVFFDSTRTEKFLGLFERKVPHLSVAQWVDAGGESGVRIAEDTNDPSLIGMMLPTADDLAQVYKPN